VRSPNVRSAQNLWLDLSVAQILAKVADSGSSGDSWLCCSGSGLLCFKAGDGEPLRYDLKLWIGRKISLEHVRLAGLLPLVANPLQRRVSRVANGPDESRGSPHAAGELPGFAVAVAIPLKVIHRKFPRARLFCAAGTGGESYGTSSVRRKRDRERGSQKTL
jgi:hypothetical protein